MDEKWNKCGESWPEKDYIKCWVWPYYDFEGIKHVSQSWFLRDRGGEGFESSYPPQKYTHWKQIIKPAPPTDDKD